MRQSFVLGPLALFLAIASPDTAAFNQWSIDGFTGNCATCHGDFRAANYVSRKDGVPWDSDLHNAHRMTMLNGDCGTCHSAGAFFPVILNSSAGGLGFEAISCVGCHGLIEDSGGDGISTGYGRGLRQHHQTAGISSCSTCHSDTMGPPGAGEDVSPPYYFTPDPEHPGKPTSACNDDGSESLFGPTGLDNDGDLLDDGADPDCAANIPPVADANGPYTGTVGVPVQFDGSGSHDPDGTIMFYDWDFGDGTFAINAGPNPTHTYSTDDVFSVTLSVTDDSGASSLDATTATIGLGALPPVSDPNGPYSGMVGMSLQFDGSGSTDPDGTIVAFDWDFGDGTSGSGVTPTHTYGSAGLYNVILTVTDDSGLVDSAGTTADIAQPGQLDLDIARFSATKRVSASRPKLIGITLVVKNNGSEEGSAMATITGEQNGVIVYNEVLQVTDLVGNGRTRYGSASTPPVPTYLPIAAGDILWTAMISDDDPDVDVATAVTRVVE